VVAGTLCGLAAGLVRMAQGGHFLSDVIFAGVLMVLTVSLAHKLMLARTTRRWLRPSGVRHRVKRICTREGVLLERRVCDGLALIATLWRPAFESPVGFPLLPRPAILQCKRSCWHRRAQRSWQHFYLLRPKILWFYPSRASRQMLAS
jgi:hypothetical protein